MQMMILNNSDAMNILLECHNYAHEERLRVNRLMKIALQQDVINFRLVWLLKRIDRKFFGLWRVECAYQNALLQDEPIPEEHQAKMTRYVDAALDCIDRDFTEASRIAGIV